MFRRHAVSIALLAAIILLSAAPGLTHAVNCDPELFASGLTINAHPPFPGEACSVDPSVGMFVGALGHLAAEDWLHGTIPWWNPLTGAGMPLAAEMQDEAFFLPFVLLLHFQSGLFWQRLLLQCGAGLFTYAFLTQLRLRRPAALFGACLFALGGSFILDAGAPAAPAMFLPALLLGIEQASSAAAARRPGGWSLIVVSLAASLYAGFPELAYFDGLLAAAWSALRFFQSPARWHFTAKLALATVIGLALTAPLTIPFLAYLKTSDLFAHNGWLASTVFPAAAAPLQLFPLFYGELGAYVYHPQPGFNDMFVRIGGWFGIVPAYLALLAVSGQRSVPRLLLAAWICFWEARFFGLPPFTALADLIPAVAASDVIRFSGTSVEFAVFILAAFAADDLLAGPTRWRLATAGLALLAAASIAPGLPFLAPWLASYPVFRPWAIMSALASIATAAGIIAAVATHRFIRTALGATILCATTLFAFSQYQGRHSGQLDTAGIAYLQAHAGLQRIFTISTFLPNYPARYGLAAINAFQLPIPANWDSYYAAKLSLSPTDIISPNAANALAHLSALQAMGVKYIVLQPAITTYLIAAHLLPPQTILVARSPTTDILQLPAPAPYASAPGCTLIVPSRTDMTSLCPAPSTLTRLELFYPGWQARINGVPTPMHPTGEIFQAVPLPAGRSLIHFTYRPPYTDESLAASCLALLLWAGLTVTRRPHKPGKNILTRP